MVILSTSFAVIFLLLFIAEFSNNRELHKRLRDIKDDYDIASCECFFNYEKLMGVKSGTATVIEGADYVKVSVEGVVIRQWEMNDSNRDYLLVCAQELADAINDEP